MKIHSIEAGNFKLDGGAMFGVVPKSLWQRTNPADSNNMIDMAARCLLVENGDRLTLIDTGMGNKQSEKFFGYYFMDHIYDLDSSLKKAGFSRDDITDVFLTHLHFDHCGGVIEKKKNDFYEPAFANAKFWTNEEHWKWAVEPNAREKASFLTENIKPIEESGQLNFIKQNSSFATQNEMDFDILFVDGHTEKMMIPHITIGDKTLVYMADLLPTAGHIPIPYVMGYDTRPLLTLDEKAKFLNEAATKGYYLILEHDPNNEIITVKHTEKGVRLDKSLTFNDLFN
ncbi:MBL fold metallo-hydrolase [Nonlabens ulvanivorans]|uniref:Beta-lactamase n=2 Tax=Nonlabens ulvanivorans TaxID=906888 RepID=A0A084JU41_NONUL|nr:MBL fold metallo-hydrolase [Nonlabens ulvanivorans]KEZ92475.1 beta-lactamase [Nonlabens ulvanivorans]PRX15312.1 glyoxylase-like metal-dependent hydrolase (beta-lactamase superfamily II) [Nonlabens ulvanivorans]GAK74720.1 beta-lactamase-like [Nonlabens ulvanivorans]